MSAVVLWSLAGDHKYHPNLARPRHPPDWAWRGRTGMAGVRRTARAKGPGIHANWSIPGRVAV